jgi:GntR family transcriptional regulator, transcriptional repressor for pyruvate dehydrogenase complex
MTEATFSTIRRQPKLSDQVTAAIEQLITQRKLLVGEKLPAERILCERFGVSRTAVREAVRSLEAKGLLEVRAGGGTWIRRPSVRPASQLLGLAMQAGNAGVTWAHVLEARRILEVEIAGLAAERHEPADLKALQQAIADMYARQEDAEGWSEADVRFHDTLAAATKNPLMPVLLGSMQDALLGARRLAHRVRSTPSNALLNHQRILQHVEQGDVAGARVAMLQHLQESETTLTRAHEIAEQERVA